MKAFRAACHYGDPQADHGDGNLRIMSDAAFQKILVFTLNEADTFFRRLLGVAGKLRLQEADFKTAKCVLCQARKGRCTVLHDCSC